MTFRLPLCIPLHFFFPLFAYVFPYLLCVGKPIFSIKKKNPKQRNKTITTASNSKRHYSGYSIIVLDYTEIIALPFFSLILAL